MGDIRGDTSKTEGFLPARVDSVPCIDRNNRWPVGRGTLVDNADRERRTVQLGADPRECELEGAVGRTPVSVDFEVGGSLVTCGGEVDVIGASEGPALESSG